MMYAKKIRMKQGCSQSSTPIEIAEIYVDGCDNAGFFSKETLHNYLKNNPDTIKVNTSPYPYVVPATSSTGEKYVRSKPNAFNVDNLLNLPRA